MCFYEIYRNNGFFFHITISIIIKPGSDNITNIVFKIKPDPNPADSDWVSEHVRPGFITLTITQVSFI